MRNGLILMTALPPTLGHEYLINFAHTYLKSLDEEFILYVMLNSRPQEPIPGNVRFDALKNHFSSYENIKVVHYNLDVPQNPSEHSDFWNIWKNLILKTCNLYEINENDIVFASEKYGIKLAETLECEFIPCNVYRQIIDVNATKIRKDPINNFHLILPEMQSYFRRTVTFFGAESCGKSTLSKKISEEMNGYWIPEWAREYLEVVGPDITDAKMKNIVHGQYSSQVEVSNMLNRPFVFQDTDLLSTIGYYKIFGIDVPSILVELFNKTKSDLYIVMNSNIPFEVDPIRYGGTVRESTDSFWVELLEEYGCNYYYMRATDRSHQLTEAIQTVMNDFNIRGKLSDFTRT